MPQLEEPNISEILQKHSLRMDAALRRSLPEPSAYPSHLAQAMRYAVFSGGKRVRPFLVLEAARACGGSLTHALPLACAVEFIHTYSLIHDDLPAMDNDDLRRGKATCHKKFDEATAILAGDALLSHAFDVLARVQNVPADRVLRSIRILAAAIGPYGMVAGQAADLKLQGTKTNVTQVTKVNGYKTGALITSCLEAGAVWGGGSSSQIKALTRYGQMIGFLFQVVDDIIDLDGVAALIGEEAAYQKASRLRDRAQAALKDFGERGEILSTFAHMLYERKK